MKIKVTLLILAVLAAWAYWTKSLYDDNKAAEIENKRLSGELKKSIEQSQLKAKAFAEREQSLINDRKEIENEYKKLLEFRKASKHYTSWADVALPDTVSDLL